MGYENDAPFASVFAQKYKRSPINIQFAYQKI